MKLVVILVAAVLVAGLACAKPSPRKKTIDCTGFPKELSGRIIEVTNAAQGKLQHTDMPFNLDVSLQRLQGEVTVGELGHYNMILDYKEGKTYIIHLGDCFTAPLPESLPFPGHLEGATSLGQGSLGVQGPSVEVYEIDKEEIHEVTTVQSGGQCIPLTFAAKTKDGHYSAGSFLDLKTTADPEKLQIPEECKQKVNVVSAMTSHTRDLNSRMKQTLQRAAPHWVRSADENDQRKRGLPWVLPGLTQE